MRKSVLVSESTINPAGSGIFEVTKLISLSIRLSKYGNRRVYDETRRAGKATKDGKFKTKAIYNDLPGTFDDEKNFAKLL